MKITFTATQGVITFDPEVRVSLFASEAELTVTIEAPEPTALPNLKRVVTEHLDRFARDEAPLPFVWS